MWHAHEIMRRHVSPARLVSGVASVMASVIGVCGDNARAEAGPERRGAREGAVSLRTSTGVHVWALASFFVIIRTVY